MKRKLLSLLVLLMMAATGAWAKTVTITYSDLPNEYGSYTQDGVTITADFISPSSIYGDVSFSTSSGKFTQIVITADNFYSTADGWSGSTWTGNASSVTAGDIYGITKIEFTISDGGGITWTSSDLAGNGIVTKDGVTLTPSNGDAHSGNSFWDYGDNTFSTTLGNFTKIEIVCTGDYGLGWNRVEYGTYQPYPEVPSYVDLYKYTWTGDASEVTIHANVYEIQSITFTIGASGGGSDPSGDCGRGVTWALTLSSGVLTISGTGAMYDYNYPEDTPWYSNKDAITSVVIESGVTHIGDYAFCSCANLASVTIPEGVMSIGEIAFSDTGLTTVEIPASVTSIEVGVFAGCSALTSVTIPNGVTSIGNGAFTQSGLTSINIPATVTSIGNSAFADCSNLETITLNSNPFIDEYAFDGIKTGAAVTMTLTANTADGANWMTFYNKNYSFGADANTQIFKAALSGKTLELTELTTDQIVNKDKAVILKSTASPIVMTLKSADGSNNFTGNSLQGVSDPDGLTAADPSTTYVLNYKSTNGVGFYKLATGSKVDVGKAYLTYSASAREFFGFEETETTSIESVSVNEDENSEVYDLQGRRVSQPTKGLYIVNGKKVFINK